MEQNQPYPQQPLGPGLFDTDRYGKVQGVAALLAIIIGGLGIQYFYLGKTKAGIISIILSAGTCGFFSLIFFIQGILMLIMSHDDFERKYEASESTFPLF
jgi:TM2 domain-containing membrane protein YozV